MSKSTKNIHSLHSLEKEIFKLQLKARAIEDTLDHNFDHLQDNFNRMAWNSLVRYKSNKQSWSAGVVQGLLGQDRIQDALAKLVAFLADRLSDGLDGLINRVFGKKKG